MKIAIHQPEYWPVPRLLAKWAQADLLVILDIVHFDRSSLQHRCKLASPDGQLRWLTIPFHHNGTRALHELLPVDMEWIARHWRTIREWYRYADADRLDRARTLYDRFNLWPANTSIAEFSEQSMRDVARHANIDVPTRRASNLIPPDGHWGAKTDLILNICRAVGATTYLSGRSGAEYLLPAASYFHQAGIGIEIQTYPEAAEVPGLSSLHTYLQHGEARLRELVRR